jgi:hypothetical protein
VIRFGKKPRPAQVSRRIVSVFCREVTAGATPHQAKEE